MLRSKKSLGTGVALAAALSLSTAGAAFADLAPSAGDAVGVGSDTVQNIANFLADGDNIGDPGYNGTGPKNRLVSFDATPDANDRAGYANGSTTSAPVALNPTIVLRQGLQPVLRPNGSGAGIKALLLDAPHNIDYVRMSRLPTTTEQNTATGNAGIGALRVIKISDDNLKMAVGTTTNAPTNISHADLVAIYECTKTTWNQVGGTSTATIKPQIPQANSGTGSTFIADLTSFKGSAVTIGSCVAVGEENDPSVFKSGAAANPDVIGPFSEGRKTLYDAHYFNDPSKAYGTAQTPLSSGVNLMPTVTYNNPRGLYIVFRNSDVTSTTKFQPGGALNLIQDLFYNPTNVGGATPYVASDGGSADILAGGGTPAYKDCGSGAAVTSC